MATLKAWKLAFMISVVLAIIVTFIGAMYLTYTRKDIGNKWIAEATVALLIVFAGIINAGFTYVDYSNACTANTDQIRATKAQNKVNHEAQLYNRITGKRKAISKDKINRTANLKRNCQRNYQRAQHLRDIDKEAQRKAGNPSLLNYL